MIRLARVTKKKEKKHKLVISGVQKGISLHIPWIWKNKKECREQRYTRIFHNLNEMDQFLDMSSQNVHKNRLSNISIKEIKSKINNILRQKTPGPESFMVNSSFWVQCDHIMFSHWWPEKNSLGRKFPSHFEIHWRILFFLTSYPSR